MHRLVFFLIAAHCFSIANACANTWGGETRFGISPESDFLAPNEVSVTLRHSGKKYWIEASTFVDVSAESIYKVSMDYDNYRSFAPYVKGSRIVEEQRFDTSNGQVKSADGHLLDRQLVFWSRMEYIARFLFIKNKIISKTYVDVQGLRGVSADGDFAIRWHLTPRKSEWIHPAESAFSTLDGSWYILPVGPNRSYLRYFFKINVESIVPDGILEVVLSDSLEPGVRNLIDAIVKRANSL